MSVQPLVSVQITTYNHRSFIGQAIDGALQQQTTFPFEIVVGEDCSTDCTRDIVLDYQRRYPGVVRAIVSESNVGAKINNYRTMKACAGKYVALCDGDDYWHYPQKLQKQVDYMECHPECSMVHSSYDIFDEASRTLIKDYIEHRHFTVPQNPDISEVLLGCREFFRIQTSTVMIRKCDYEATVEADPHLHKTGPFLMGDVQLWAELSLRGRIGFTPESLATYRLLQESASRSRCPVRSLRFEVSQHEMALYLCEKHKLPAAVKRNRELMLREMLLRLAFHTGDSELAARAGEMRGSLTLNDRLLMLGARSGAARRLLRAAIEVRSLLSRAKENVNA